MYDRHAPLPDLTWLQWLLWPLIFARLIALKLQVRAQYGRGVPYHYKIGPFGEVHFLGLCADPDAAPVVRLLGHMPYADVQFFPSLPARLAAALAPHVPAPPPAPILRERAAPGRAPAPCFTADTS
ncbi:hypothetical protein [Hyphomonas sp.]|uniref:hypothetical protein n=1 Tax=Hyphomonas sp. TaxID=87 RepID=UPI00391BF0C5